ncbi:MAG: hypothetical protein IT373_27825, partial [Polyangiaceae bacterium]|nr:hypothetical protein [Polyangiaceae bacterium]
MGSYDESELRSLVDAALGRIKTILEHTKNPCYAADVPHRYDDKFHLVEFMGRG